MTTGIRSNTDGSKSYIQVGGTDVVTLGTQGIEAGSFAPGSIGDADLSLSANSSPVKAALNATGGAPIYACRAWVNFNGTGTVAILASGNVSSITDNGTGSYTINLTKAMPDANYSVVGSSNNSANTSYLYVVVLNGSIQQTTSSVGFFVKRSGDHANSDNSVVNIAVFR